MPTVAKTNSSARRGAAQALTSAAAGAVEGAKLAEDQRRDTRDFDESTRRFDADLAFRMDQLKVMQEQGYLNRKQQDRLARMQEQGLSGRQERGIEAGIETREDTQQFQTEVREDVQVHEDEQLADRLKQSDIEDRRRNYTAQRGQDVGLKGQTLAIEAQTNRALFDQGTYLDVMGRVLNGRSYASMTPAEREQAISDFAVQTRQIERFDRDEHGALTDNAQILTYNSIANQMANYESNRQQYDNDLARKAEMLSRGRRGVSEDFGAEDQGSIPANVLFMDQFDPSDPIDALTGMGKLNNKALASKDWRRLDVTMAGDQIEIAIARTVADLSKPNLTPEFAEGKKRELFDLVDSNLRHMSLDLKTHNALDQYWRARIGKAVDKTYNAKQ